MKHAKEPNKTNALRIAEQAGIVKETFFYEVDEDHIDGKSIAAKVGWDLDQVFKTLVTRGASGGIYVFCVPCSNELNLKKAARAVHEKNIEMTRMDELLGLTGYIRGGCSPIGMKKKYPTVIDETAILFDTILLSAGKRGEQMAVSPEPLAELIGAQFADITD